VQLTSINYINKTGNDIVVKTPRRSDHCYQS